MNLRIPLFVLVFCAVAAGAQETEPPAPEAAKTAAAPAETPPAPAAGEEPLTAPAPDTKAAGPSPDSFKPSEEISEDLSVSFPVDI